jgi:AcrR family transcriptional regulator
MVQPQVTKYYMGMALMTALSRQRKSKLTVTAFLKEAEICRTTFYNHFPDGICGLYRWLLEDRVLKEARESFEAGQWQAGCQVIIDFIASNANVCLNLYRFSDETERRRFFKRFAMDILDSFLLQHREQLTQTERDCFIDFYSDALIGQLEHWFESGLKLPKEQLNERVTFNLVHLQQLLAVNQ